LRKRFAADLESSKRRAVRILMVSGAEIFRVFKGHHGKTLLLAVMAMGSANAVELAETNSATAITV